MIGYSSKLSTNIILLYMIKIYSSKYWCAFINKWVVKLSYLIPSDRLYLNVRYYLKFNRKIDWKNPKSYTEKLQWLKVYNRVPLYSKLVDKFEVKSIVADIIGEEHIIKTLGIWNSFSEIDFGHLPKQFVLKCTHDSGGLVIVKDRDKMNMEKIKVKIEKCLKYNFYQAGREWPYKNVQPRIIAEEYMTDESHTELKDYKFFCFDGEPKFLFIASDRPYDTRFDFFDLDFKHLPFTNGHPLSNKVIKKPKGFETMISLAKKLSKGMPHVRIDFYDIDGKVYFGEYTFFHHSGFESFDPVEWDYKIGNILTIHNDVI